MSGLFDVNAMVGKFPTGELAYHDVAGLKAHMARHGIGRALVYHSLAWQHDPAVGNRLLLEELKDDPTLMPCWVILPVTTGEIGSPDEFLDAMDTHGVKAVRAFPRDHVYRLVGPDCDPLLERLAQRRIPLLIDVEQSSWPEIESLAAAYPELPVVVCRTGYRSLRMIAGILERRPNVHLDLAYLSTHLGVEWLAARFGARRLLFGTGMPFTDAGGAVTRLQYAELDDAAVAAIGGGTLKRLLEGGADRA